MTHSPICQQFNNAAARYHHYASSQYYIGMQLIDYLQQHCDSRKSIVDMGAGSGTLSAYLYTKLKPSELLLTDASPAMLLHAKKHFAEKRNVDFIQHNFDDPLPFPPKEIIFSNMAFHWSADLKPLLHNAHHHCQTLVFSIPLQGTYHEIQEGSRLHFLDRESINQMLHGAGYKNISNQEEYVVTHFKQAIDAYRTIRHMGCNTIPKRQSPKVCLPRDISTLTYHVGLFIASA